MGLLIAETFINATVLEDNEIKNPYILIVDDQLFNINALIIMLNHGVKIDTDNLCNKALSG